MVLVSSELVIFIYPISGVVFKFFKKYRNRKVAFLEIFDTILDDFHRIGG